jgi:hypothetical protein
MNPKGTNGHLKTQIRKMKILFETHLLGTRKPPESAKSQIMQRFDKWLDDVLTEQKPLEGLDQELLSELEGETNTHVKNPIGNSHDIYSTWGAITALTGEVKLQGRAFRDLSNDLGSLSELRASVDHLATAHRDAVADARGMAENAHSVLTGYKNDLKTEADVRARREVVNVLLDTRERLVIGLNSTKESQQKLDACAANWLNRWLNGKNPGVEHAVDIIASLKKGYGLGLDRLNETIRKFGVFEIECAGKLFDPNIMTAVDVEERTDIPDGTVLEVFRTGYATDSEMIRPAEVKVVRALEMVRDPELKQ